MFEPASLSLPSHHRPDGNRLAAGTGAPQMSATHMLLDQPVTWIAAQVGAAGIEVVATDEQGEVAGLTLSNGRRRALATLPPGAPPLVVPGSAGLVVAPPPDASPFTAPALLSNGGLAYVDTGGDLVIAAGDTPRVRIALDALPDGRIAVGPDDRLLVLTGPTDRYPHAVLGDALEAAGFAIVDGTSGQILSTVGLDNDAVFEAVVPMWADVDGDGAAEIVLTVSDAIGGARIVAYDQAGTLVAEGEPIGRGNRWRHLIAVGPLGPSGETEIAVVRTPHIGGVLELYRFDDGGFTITESKTGPYGSHGLGSRNLDMAIAGDFDRDGRIEVVLPSANRSSIHGVVHTADGIETAWSAELPAPLTSNLAAVAGPEGLRLIAGLRDGSVTVWSP